MQKQYRQGDVFLIEVSEDPKGKEVERINDEIVLAYGEATGHHHHIPNKGAVLYAVNENLRILKVEEEVELRHEEHEAIKLPPGNFQVIQQRENTPLGWRTVVD